MGIHKKYIVVLLAIALSCSFDFTRASDKQLMTEVKAKAKVIVAKDSSGDFKTVSEAVAAASETRFVIYVKAGTYIEKVNVNKSGITLIGDGKYSTIISGSDTSKHSLSLSGSATISITGNYFIARDIGFENTAGPNAEQAVALHTSSFNSTFYRCSIIGNQDTLYAEHGRQFYRECDISGTVDFICGNAAAIFQKCNLILRKPHSGGGYDVILANSRTYLKDDGGFVVQGCTINATYNSSSARSAYLGRPWKPYSRSVVMQSIITGTISPQGWDEWPNTPQSARTLYFAEYENTGPGAKTSERVKWTGFHILTTTEATKFTVANFIFGNSWLPSTGVPYTSGL